MRKFFFVISLLILISLNIFAVQAVSPITKVKTLKISPTPTASVTPSATPQPTPEVIVKTELRLPYSGILPGHPLYFFKDLKDRFLVWVVKNPEDRAKILIFYSRKKLSIAKGLLDQNSTSEVGKVLERSRNYLNEALTIDLTNSKEKSAIAIMKLSAARERQQFDQSYQNQLSVNNFLNDEEKFLRMLDGKKAALTKDLFQMGK